MRALLSAEDCQRVRAPCFLNLARTAASLLTQHSLADFKKSKFKQHHTHITTREREEREGAKEEFSMRVEAERRRKKKQELFVQRQEVHAAGLYSGLECLHDAQDSLHAKHAKHARTPASHGVRVTVKAPQHTPVALTR